MYPWYTWRRCAQFLVGWDSCPAAVYSALQSHSPNLRPRQRQYDPSPTRHLAHSTYALTQAEGNLPLPDKIVAAPASHGTANALLPIQDQRHPRACCPDAQDTSTQRLRAATPSSRSLSAVSEPRNISPLSPGDESDGKRTCS